MKGDNLSKISKMHYGDPNKYMTIFEANKPMLKHPDKIYPGQMLRIPPGVLRPRAMALRADVRGLAPIPQRKDRLR